MPINIRVISVCSRMLNFNWIFIETRSVTIKNRIHAPMEERLGCRREKRNAEVRYRSSFHR